MNTLNSYLVLIALILWTVIMLYIMVLCTVWLFQPKDAKVDVVLEPKKESE